MIENRKSPLSPKHDFRKDGRPIIVKIQSVRTVELFDGGKDAKTIGQQIDMLIADSVNDGVSPNKLIVDLEPHFDNPARMD